MTLDLKIVKSNQDEGGIPSRYQVIMLIKQNVLLQHLLARSVGVRSTYDLMPMGLWGLGSRRHAFNV